MKNSEFCEIFSRILWPKFNENSRQVTMSLNVKSKTFCWKILLIFIKIGKIFVKNSDKRWMKSTEFTLFSRKFTPRYLPVKNENQKNLFNSIFYAGQAFNDTSLNSLRWKYQSAKIALTKNPFEYIVPPSTNGVEKLGNNNNRDLKRPLKTLICSDIATIIYLH